MFDHEYPYTNNHELNLDWIIKTVKDTVEQFANVKQTFEEAKAEFEEAKAEFEEAKLEFKALKTRFNELLSEFGDVKQAFEAFKEEVIALIPDEVRAQVRPVLDAMVTDGTLQQLLVDVTGSMSNRNLLDNPWFTVNQRGFTSATNLFDYMFDRWQIGYNPQSAIFSNQNGMLNIATSNDVAIAYQKMEHKDISGKMCTVSVKLSDDTILTGNSIFPLEGAPDVTPIISAHCNVYFQYVTSGIPLVGILVGPNANTTIKAIKLELGTVSTLVNDVAPNYAEELAKCQRYFYRINGNATSKTFFGLCISATSDSIYFPLINSVNMRTAPVISQNSIILFKNNMPLTITINNIIVQRESTNTKRILIEFNETIFSGADEVSQIGLDNGGYIDLSADL